PRIFVQSLFLKLRSVAENPVNQPARRIPAQSRITDLAMPEKDGIETIRMIRYEYPELKIIAISGAFGPEVLRVSRILGAAASLHKPVDAATLLHTVQDLLAPSNSQVPQP